MFKIYNFYDISFFINYDIIYLLDAFNWANWAQLTQADNTTLKGQQAQMGLLLCTSEKAHLRLTSNIHAHLDSTSQVNLTFQVDLAVQARLLNQGDPEVQGCLVVKRAPIDSIIQVGATTQVDLVAQEGKVGLRDLVALLGHPIKVDPVVLLVQEDIGPQTCPVVETYASLVAAAQLD